MKYIGWFTGILVAFVGFIYVMAFTSFGNSFLKPVIEKKMQEATGLESKIKHFSLGKSDFEIFLEFNEANSVEMKGDYSLFSQAFNIIYRINFESLQTLGSLTRKEFQGTFKSEGSIVGNKEEIFIIGKSDIANSNTSFSLVLKELEPRVLSVSIENMKLQDILYMLKEPHYGDGLLSLEAQIDDVRVESLSGVIAATIKEGLFDSRRVTKEFKLATFMPKTTFNAKLKTILTSKSANSELDFTSTLANLKVKNMQFLYDDVSVVSDYTLKLPDLSRLYFITQRALKGSVIVSGEIKKDKEFDVSAYSNIGGGKLEVKLHNDQLKANFKAINTLELLEMFLYPKIFASSIDGTLNYNLLQKKGEFQAKLSDGKFMQNEILDLAKKYAKTDLYQERFRGNIRAKIVQDNILASLKLSSNSTSLESKDTKLNTKTRQIVSKININANQNPFSVSLSGDANAPKIAIDLSEIIKRELPRELERLFRGLF